MRLKIKVYSDAFGSWGCVPRMLYDELEPICGAVPGARIWEKGGASGEDLIYLPGEHAVSGFLDDVKDLEAVDSVELVRVASNIGQYLKLLPDYAAAPLAAAC